MEIDSIYHAYLHVPPKKQTHYTDNIRVSAYLVYLYLKRVRFVNHELAFNWYTGAWTLDWLLISTEQLHSIHSGAFDRFSLKSLEVLKFRVAHGFVRIHDGVFAWFSQLSMISFFVKNVRFPIGLYDSLANTILDIRCSAWPSTIGLNGMFGNEKYRLLRVLTIANVESPQTMFHTLARANFTSFKRLKHLHLIKCGIEVVDDHAFDAISHTLEVMNLEGNRIKFINVEIFRGIFEANSRFRFRLNENGEHLQCTCQAIEVDVMRCPLVWYEDDTCIACTSPEDFDPDTCNIYRNANFSKFIINEALGQTYWRIFRLRMAIADGAELWIRTDFSGNVRILMVNFEKMTGDCDHRAAATHFKCLSIDKFVLNLDLHDIDELRNAEIISITAIPILISFGTRPMHSMTVRRQTNDAFWLSFDLLPIWMTTVILFVAFGFGCGVSIELLRVYWTEWSATTHDRTNEIPSYGYYATQADRNYDEIDEGPPDRTVNTCSSYLEVI